MKWLILLPLSIALAGATLAACTHPEPEELAKARTAYDEAAHGLAAQLAPVDLHAAQQQLARAERSFEQNGPSQETRDSRVRRDSQGGARGGEREDFGSFEGGRGRQGAARAREGREGEANRGGSV